MGLSVHSCVEDEEPHSSIPEHPKRPLPSSVRIRYGAWAWTCCNLPFQKFLGFRNCGIELVTPSMEHSEVSCSKPLFQAGNFSHILNTWYNSEYSFNLEPSSGLDRSNIACVSILMLVPIVPKNLSLSAPKQMGYFMKYFF